MEPSLIIAVFLILLTGLFLKLRKGAKVPISRKKVVIITGCDSGFGYEMSIKLRALGFTIISCVLNEESVRPLEEKGIFAKKCDVRNEEEVFIFDFLYVIRFI